MGHCLHRRNNHRAWLYTTAPSRGGSSTGFSRVGRHSCINKSCVVWAGCLDGGTHVLVPEELPDVCDIVVCVDSLNVEDRIVHVRKQVSVGGATVLWMLV